MKMKRVLCSIVAGVLISTSTVSLSVAAAEPSTNEFTGSAMATSSTQVASGGTISSGQSGGSVSDERQGDSSATVTDNTTTNSVIVAGWKPVTAEEKEIFALIGTEKVSILSSGTKVKAVNSIQGKQCYAIFKSCAGDYTLARTYSIFPEGSSVNKPVYETALPITITLKIPSSVLEENRTYRMIGVTKNGVPTIYQDEDKDPDTITITTNHFYAYALCYKNN